jgi:hypothetical protein
VLGTLEEAAGYLWLGNTIGDFDATTGVAFTPVLE